MVHLGFFAVLFFLAELFVLAYVHRRRLRCFMSRPGPARCSSRPPSRPRTPLPTCRSCCSEDDAGALGRAGLQRASARADQRAAGHSGLRVEATASSRKPATARVSRGSRTPPSSCSSRFWCRCSRGRAPRAGATGS
jgi:hypothetical protein